MIPLFSSPKPYEIHTGNRENMVGKVPDSASVSRGTPVYESTTHGD